jgi:hypothetical protein
VSAPAGGSRLKGHQFVDRPVVAAVHRLAPAGAWTGCGSRSLGRPETEAAPIRYVAELVGTETDSERAIRWLIALMVLCCDPFAITLRAAASARRSTF